MELLKQKGAYPYEYINSFQKFNEEKLPDKKYFYSSVKDGTTGDNGKIIRNNNTRSWNIVAEWSKYYFDFKNI